MSEETMLNDLESDFSEWVSNLEEIEVTNSCSIDNPECETCGS